MVTPAVSEQQTLHPGINHYTQLAHLVSEQLGLDGSWYSTVRYLTDVYGRKLTVPVEGVVKSSELHRIAGSRPAPRDQGQMTFYRRDPAGTLVAEGFVDTTDDRGLVNVGRIPLGTGVYGKYTTEEGSIRGILPNQTVYRMDGSHCYQLINGPHGDLLTLASIFTNIYLSDAVAANTAESSAQEGLISVTADELMQLTTLWWMTLVQTGDGEGMTTEWMDHILREYLAGYWTTALSSADVELRPVQRQPINLILGALGYAGIFATDSYNNSRDRGCVSYELDGVTSYRIAHGQFW